jgi:hypothetical protein
MKVTLHFRGGSPETKAYDVERYATNDGWLLLLLKSGGEKVFNRDVVTYIETEDATE